jgi:GNAT superfamily N-acetyltransferase
MTATPDEPRATTAAPLTLRAPTADDADAIASLLAELGHPADAGDVPARLAAVRAEGGALLLAVSEAGDVLGLIGMAKHAVVHEPGPVGYITALVTTAAVRGRGVGRALVAEAQEWARREGCVRLSVTSAEHRADAHAFYPACGLPYTGRRFSAPVAPRATS